MLEEFDNALHPNDEILFFKENFNKVPFIASQRYILAVGLDKINLDEDIILMKMTIILLLVSDFLLGIVNLKNTKHL